MGDVIRLSDRRRRPAAPRDPAPVLTPGEPLWREVVGRRLRLLRHERGERLADTAARAGISAQYLSEVERGRKEPSSETLAAVAGALGTSLRGVVRRVDDDLTLAARGPVLLAA